jgi:hypothetical protein
MSLKKLSTDDGPLQMKKINSLTAYDNVVVLQAILAI